MANLVPYQEGLYVPVDYTRAGLVYFVGGLSGIGQSDWMALSLTPESLVLCDRHRAFFPIHLLNIRKCRVEAVNDLTITLPSPSGPQMVAPISPYAIIVTFVHKPDAGGDERELTLYVGYRDVAQEWVNEIYTAIDRCREEQRRRVTGRSGQGP